MNGHLGVFARKLVGKVLETEQESVGVRRLLMADKCVQEAMQK